jgi:hypothetical protein
MVRECSAPLGERLSGAQTWCQYCFLYQMGLTCSRSLLLRLSLCIIRYLMRCHP